MCLGFERRARSVDATDSTSDEQGTHEDIAVAQSRFTFDVSAFFLPMTNSQNQRWQMGALEGSVRARLTCTQVAGFRQPGSYLKDDIVTWGNAWDTSAALMSDAYKQVLQQQTTKKTGRTRGL